MADDVEMKQLEDDNLIGNGNEDEESGDDDNPPVIEPEIVKGKCGTKRIEKFLKDIYKF